MFGSLVMCLPTEFAGGELVLRGPGGVQYTQSWGSSSAESPALQWAAFYSDMEHVILPVTSGYRVTLTYNLYHVSDDSAAAALPLHFVNARNSLFGESLAACIADGSWHSTGATLGFALVHYYAASSRPPVKLETGMLKDSGLLLQQALKDAGLFPQLAPLLRMPHASGPFVHRHRNVGDKPGTLLLGAGFGRPQQLGEPDPEEDSDDSDDYYHCETSGERGLFRSYEQESEREFLAVRHGASSLPSNMVWAKPPSNEHWMYKDRAPAWGN